MSKKGNKINAIYRIVCPACFPERVHGVSEIKYGKRYFFKIMCSAGVLLLSINFNFTLASGAQTSVEDPLINEIKDSWKSRCKDIKSIEFTVLAEEMIEKGYYSSHPLFQSADQSATNRPIFPKRDMIIESTRRVAMDGGKIMIEWSGKRPYHTKNEFVHYFKMAAFNGTGSKILQKSKNTDYQQGFVVSAKEVRDLIDINSLRPLLIWLGPLLLRQEIELSIPGDRSQNDNQDSSELVVVFDVKRKVRMWLDPSRQYCAVRYARRNSIRHWEIEVSHARLESGAWYPEKWTYASSVPGSRIVECTLGKLQINPVVPASVFEIEFPVGTLVSVEGDKKPRQYVVGELGEELPASILATVPPSRNNWLIFLNILVVVVLLLLAVFRARKSKSSV